MNENLLTFIAFIANVVATVVCAIGIVIVAVNGGSIAALIIEIVLTIVNCVLAVYNYGKISKLINL